jgi:hypothetical protein
VEVAAFDDEPHAELVSKTAEEDWGSFVSKKYKKRKGKATRALP